MYGEFINSINTVHSCEVEHIEFDELILSFSREVPSYDTIFCLEDKARIVAMHLNSLNRFPEAYSVLVGDDVRIYKKVVPEDNNFFNFPYISMLIALSDMLETELDFKAMGQKLRRAVAFTTEKCYYRQKGEFQKHLLIEINTPIRHRRAKG